MSVGSEIKAVEVKVAGWYSKIKTRIKVLIGQEPKWEPTAIAALQVVTPVAVGICALVDPPLIPLVTGASQAIVADLAALTEVIKGAGPEPSILSLIDSVKTNINKVLQIVAVKSPASQAKVTGAVSGIVTVLDEIVADFQALKSLPSTEAPSQQ